MFTGWVYDHLTKHSSQVKVAHPAMLKAISAGKKKNDRVPYRHSRAEAGPLPSADFRSTAVPNGSNPTATHKTQDVAEPIAAADRLRSTS
jgi:hypothetical protein